MLELFKVLGCVDFGTASLVCVKVLGVGNRVSASGPQGWLHLATLPDFVFGNSTFHEIGSLFRFGSLDHLVVGSSSSLLLLECQLLTRDCVGEGSARDIWRGVLAPFRALTAVILWRHRAVAVVLALGAHPRGILLGACLQ